MTNISFGLKAEQKSSASDRRFHSELTKIETFERKMEKIKTEERNKRNSRDR